MDHGARTFAYSDLGVLACSASQLEGHTPRLFCTVSDQQALQCMGDPFGALGSGRRLGVEAHHRYLAAMLSRYFEIPRFGFHISYHSFSSPNFSTRHSLREAVDTS